MTTVHHRASGFRADVTLTVPSPVNPGPFRVQSPYRQTVPLYRLPLVATVKEDLVICDSHQLPFRSASILGLQCVDAFEFVIDDQLLMLEAARILAPGGRIEIAVPNRQRLGRVDELNLVRYVRDTTGRGVSVPELAEVGWRRHYAPAELKEMMIQAGFEQIEIQTGGRVIRESGMRKESLVQKMTRHGSVRGEFMQETLAISAKLGAYIVATAIRSY